PGVPVVPGLARSYRRRRRAEEFCRVTAAVILRRQRRVARRAHAGVRRLWRMFAEALSNGASSEATGCFWQRVAMFVERFVESWPGHIEVGPIARVLRKSGTSQGRRSVIHLLRNATAQWGASQGAGTGTLLISCAKRLGSNSGSDAVKLAKSTVEFLFEESTGSTYFMEPRGLNQSEIAASGCAMQCRVTTEDPERDFQPDSGRLEYFRPGLGPGIRLDSASAFAGAIISPFMIACCARRQTRQSTNHHVVAHTGNFAESTAKMRRALREFRVIGVNQHRVLLNLLSCEEFCTVAVDTGFLDRNPQLMRQRPSRGRVQKLLRFIVAVPPDGWRKILKQKGPEAFAKAILDHPGSLLATRVRTYDLVKIAPFAAQTLVGPAVNGVLGRRHVRRVSLRFLHECPWQRLRQLRDLVPNIPFQMLLRGANAVGYTKNYADNVVYRFCEEAVKTGMDIFRIFDCLNYVPNMLVGMDAVRKAGGVVEAAICYTGDLLTSKKYTLEYYLDTAEQLVSFCQAVFFSSPSSRSTAAGAHILAIKDMAGLLKPESARRLVTALKQKFPRPPRCTFTLTTRPEPGWPPCSACSESGADILDVSVDAMSGITAQPSMGAVVGLRRPVARRPACRSDYNAYWEMTRRLYVNFECTNTMRSGNADVYENEIPGGSTPTCTSSPSDLGLADQFALVKKKFAEANQLLGDLIKVAQKWLGDLAQFMVAEQAVKQDVAQSSIRALFPLLGGAVFDGCIGQPHGGFPAELCWGAARQEAQVENLCSRVHQPSRRRNPAIRFREASPRTGEKVRCFFEVNGQLRVLHTRDREASKDLGVQAKSSAKGKPRRSWRPDAREILSVRVTPGQMELTVASPLAGKVHSVWSTLATSGEDDAMTPAMLTSIPVTLSATEPPALAACLPAPIVNARWANIR
uniref:Biotin carboxylation domain-containing protein n=1 Tax=Macrostomum lignano TaxID=282301 RepID=A0A1I8FDE2_9PLAT